MRKEKKEGKHMKNDTIKKSVYSKFDDERSVAMSILPKPDKKLKTRKLLLILLYVGFVGLWGIALAVLQTYAMYIAALSLVTLLILIFFTWRYAKVEYEMTVHMGQLGLAVIYGGLTRKDLLSCRVQDLKVIAPYETEAQKAEADGFAADKKYVMLSGADDKPVWYAIYAPENGEKVVMIFDTEEKLRKMLKYYGGEAFKG